MGAGGGLGAYGLRLPGLGGAAALMQPQDPSSPVLRIEVASAHGDERSARAPVLTDSLADLPLLGGGHLRMERDSGTAQYLLAARPPDEELLHPYLAPAAALHWQWSGREALHAGVVSVDGRAVLLLGDKESGKSTTLGWLATVGGAVVLADDLAVIDGTDALAGPRSLDLRPGSELPGQPVRSVRGDRLRLELGPAPSRAPVVGIAVLDWGEDLGLTKVDFKDRLALLAAQRTFAGLAADPVALLELASTTVVRATRPRTLMALADFGRALLDYFS